MKYWNTFLLRIAPFLIAMCTVPACSDRERCTDVPTDSVIEIRPDGSGDHATIQAALDSAAAGDIIELTDGVFTGQGNRDVEFRGKAITIRSRSGDPQSCIIDCQGDSLNLHRGFLFRSAETPESVLEGITIRNGWMTGDTGVPARITNEVSSRIALGVPYDVPDHT